MSLWPCSLDCCMVAFSLYYNDRTKKNYWSKQKMSVPWTVGNERKCLFRGVWEMRENVCCVNCEKWEKMSVPWTMRNKRKICFVDCEKWEKMYVPWTVRNERKCLFRELWEMREISDAFNWNRKLKSTTWCVSERPYDASLGNHEAL